MEQKGLELMACPHVKHNHCVTLRQRILLRTGVTLRCRRFCDSSSWINPSQQIAVKSESKYKNEVLEMQIGSHFVPVWLTKQC